jgi:putative (di)nucleoside polyphosphate hydrolase
VSAENLFPKHRPNVGVVLFNRDGKVWLGRRAGSLNPKPWQFPQGGVDEGEDWEAAARRELDEETGVTSVSLLGATEDWITYDFPPHILADDKHSRGWIGQKQKWFAYRFEGDESEIDLGKHHEVEFDAWRWADLAEAPALIVDFKRDAYQRVVEAFARFAA